ncbi:MAG: TolC family protein [Fibrobacterota bacterium]
MEKNAFYPALLPALLLLCAVSLFAQELLTAEQAVALALRNNFDIRVAKNLSAISQEGDFPGAAGMLPKATAAVTVSGSNNRLSQEAAAGGVTTTPDARTSNLNPSLTLSWTLFDGLKMFAVKGRLKRLSEISELNYRDALQGTVAQTLTAYYDVVSAVQQRKGLAQTITLSEERFTIAQKKYDLGSVSKVDLLQARLDLNAQKSALLSQENTLTRKRAALNFLLARAAGTPFTTVDTIPFNSGWVPIAEAELDVRNFQLQAALKRLEAARFSRRELYAQFLPSLSATGAYGLSQSDYNYGLNASSETRGLSGSATLSYPLFNGFTDWHAARAANLTLANSQASLESARLLIRSGYFLAQKEYLKAMDILKLEEENILLADENVKIALERFRLAQTTAIEFGTAQQSYLSALTRLVTARFNAKSAETELLRLQGALVK